VKRGAFFRILLSAGGVSVLSQAVALLRQILIVSSFGIARDLDFYVTVYALFSVSILSVAGVVDSIYIGLLNERRAEGGEGALRGAFFAYMRASLLVSALVVSAIAIIFPVLAIPFTAGFSVAERASIQSLAVHFVPWALLVIPFTAMGACMKSAWNYRQFFAAELMVTLVSTGAIFLWHDHVSDIALAYAYGYGVAVFYLGMHLGRFSYAAHGIHFPWRVFLSRLSRHLGSNQVGTLYALAERFWFSYLPAGGIAALGVVQQLTMSLAGLLSLRDAYLVPLADEAGRAQKITRLLSGLFLITAVAAVFVAAAAEPICAILFQYGKAGAKDISLVANLLTIGMVGVLMSVVGTPVWRLQQVSAQYRPLVGVYLVNAALTMLLGQVFVGWLQLGAEGMAIIGAINATWVCLAALYYARAFGARLSRAQAALLLQSAIFFVLAGFVAHMVLTSFDTSAIGRLVAGGCAYGALLLVYLLVFHRRLRPILEGGGLWAV
jgi:peptidoglycan biosynthesis protein MviN/MurJ (putative lipid II flippase)